MTRDKSAAEERLRELSVVLCDFLGGGSEWFSRLGDEFYVDPRIVGPELRRRKTDAQITKGALVRANRRLAEMQSDQALLTDIFDKMAEVVAPLPGDVRHGNIDQFHNEGAGAANNRSGDIQR